MFLPTIVSAPFTAHPAVGHVIAQPVARAAQHLDVLDLQADFLVQLAIHRLFRGFARVDAALWELPSLLTDALSPEHLIVAIQQNDSDIGPVTVLVQHGGVALLAFRAGGADGGRSTPPSGQGGPTGNVPIDNSPSGALLPIAKDHAAAR